MTAPLGLTPPLASGTYQRRWWILAVLCTSLMIVMIGNTSLNIALPTLSRELDVTAAQQQWLVDGYSLVFAGLLFTMSSLGERFGRKRILQLGLVLFTGASTYAGLVADSSTELIAARVAMGAAGAMVMPATLSILTNVFPREERAKAVAIWSGVAGGAGAIGLLLSGVILEYASWHGVFLIAVPVGIVAIVAGLALVPDSRDPETGPLDLLGAALSTAGLVALVYGIIEAPAHGWTSPATIGWLAGGLALLGAFAVWELRAKHPMLDVRLFSRPAFGVSSLAMTLVFFALMGLFFSIAQLFQLVMGYSSLGSAVRMAPIALFLMISSPISPALVGRFGKRRVVAAGLAMVATGILLLANLDVSSSYAEVLLGLAVMAFGMGIAMSPTTDLLMSAVPAAKAGMGSATNDTTRELGGALGVAVIGSVMASRFASEMSGALSALPAGLRDMAGSSLGGALATGNQMGGPQGQALVTSAREAWMSGFTLAMLVGAIVVAVTAVVTWLWMPDAAQDEAEAERVELLPDLAEEASAA